MRAATVRWAIFGLLLILSVSVQAQLPDLRGKTLFITGKLLLSGEALDQNLEEYFPDGIDVTPEFGAKIIINSTGNADNSNLTGTFPMPAIPSTVPGYPVFSNPPIPLSGSFNRTTGALNVSGQINGTTVLDFGVHDTGDLAGVRRILVQVRNLRITATGTGVIDPDGAFRIKQPGITPIGFDVSSNAFTGTPRVGLQDPNSNAFPFVSVVIQNPSFRLSNWTAAEPVWSGTIGLQGCADASQPLTFAFDGPTAADDFVRTVTPNPDGTFFIPNIPAKPYTVGIKGAKWLRQTVTIPFEQGYADPTQYGTLFLRVGDANDDNFVDITDLLTLIGAYNQVAPSSGYLEAADFTCDGVNDISDLLLLISNYNQQGA
jgi:hypothetical protein